jgi:hypothetical protein
MVSLILALTLLAQSTTPPSISAAPVLPADTKASYRANGSLACSAWRSARQGKNEDSQIQAGIYRKWVLGYVTGFNTVGPDQTGNLLGTASGEELYAAIDGYCTRNPSHVVADAMRPIIEAIVGRRGTPAVGPSSATARKRATIVAPDTCRDWARDSDNAILRLAHVVALSGYVTAYNQWGPDPLGDAIGVDDQPLLESATNKWCGEHPSGLLIGTVMPLIGDVAAERAAGHLPPGGMQPNDKSSQGAPLKR